MLSARLTRQFALATGAVAIVGMGALTACSTATKDKPTEAPSSSATSAPSNAPTPTEKAVGPAGPSFSPTVKAKPAPTALPGNVVTGG